MPVNPSYEFISADDEFKDATTTEEKIKSLKKMIMVAPKHKSSEKLLKELRCRLTKLKAKFDKERTQKGKAGKGRSLSIKKEGDAQVIFIGLPNAGKSYVLEKLSGAAVPQDTYPFTTKTPTVRTITSDGAKLQGIELPAIYKGAYDTEKGPELFGFMRNADLIVLVIDGSKEVLGQVEELKSELSEAEIKLTNGVKSSSGFEARIPGIILINKEPDFSGVISGLKVANFTNVDDVKNAIWGQLGLIRVYTRTGSVVAEKPVVLKKGAIVKELAIRVHKDFVKKFRYAKVWGPSSKFGGQQVGLNHKLADRDIVEVYIE